MFLTNHDCSQESQFDNQSKRKRRQVLIKRTVDIVDQAKEGFY